MPINATVTAQTGPARQITAGVYTGMNGMLILPDRRIMQLFIGNDTNSPVAREFDLSSATTMTIAISGTTYTVTVA